MRKTKKEKCIFLVFITQVNLVADIAGGKKAEGI